MSESKTEPEYPVFPERFPPGYQNIGGKSFEEVYKTKKVFVKFTIEEMINPTGLFSQWQQYCMKYYKLEHGSSATPINRNP